VKPAPWSADIALMSVAARPLSAADRPLDVVPIHFHKEVRMAKRFPRTESDIATEELARRSRSRASSQSSPKCSKATHNAPTHQRGSRFRTRTTSLRLATLPLESYAQTVTV